MQIRVTKNDIKKGVRSHAGACPVARAIRRASKAREIGVDGINICVGTQDFTAPSVVSQFIQRFDMDGRRGLKPFTFELPIRKPKTKRTKKAVVSTTFSTELKEHQALLVAQKRVNR